MSSDLKKHIGYDPKENKLLDKLWKTYIKAYDEVEALAEKEKETILRRNEAYHEYSSVINQAIIKLRGEPYINYDDKLLVTEDCYVIRYSLNYNQTFPKSPIIVPIVGQIAVANGVNLWPGPETIAVSYYDNNVAWYVAHVPYQELQSMRKAWLELQQDS